MRDRVWASEHLVDANRVEMRRALPAINRRKEETEPLLTALARSLRQSNAGNNIRAPVFCSGVEGRWRA